MTTQTPLSVNRAPLYFAAFIIALCLAGLVFTGHASRAQAASTASDSDSVSAEERARIEAIVRDYLVREPEVLIEAFEALEEKKRAGEVADKEQAISENTAAIYEDPASFVGGNPDGDVTIVEFFDYQCGFCKRTADKLIDAVEDDGNTRLIMREFPILGPESDVAARAALAAMRQDKYLELHLALMELNGRLTEARIMGTAESVGIDTDQLARDMASPSISDAIERTKTLAQDIGVDGTPAFIVGGKLYPGALEKDQIEAIIDHTRETAS
ncbi:DsbA family protein [Tepidicaulis sp. LMO-SS28]|uniref:DsbA family protein n=1 Tax=Tepidicaulis sp. LMO-SS28 TaxID=3447455 RepID=UPI003EE309C0